MVSKTAKASKVYQDKVKVRAEYLFVAYSALGQSRSLERLQQMLTELGLKYSLTTLKNYSKKYDWVDRAAEQDMSTALVRQQNEVAQEISKMNSRQREEGKALQAIGVRGISSLNPMTFSPSDVRGLVEGGIRIERLASGEATSRQEVAIQLVTPIVQQMVNLFKQVNIIDNQDARMEKFGSGADDILQNFNLPLEA